MQWKQFRYRLEWLGVKALAILIPMLPRRVCVALADAAGAAAFVYDRRGRAVTLANLEAALGDAIPAGCREAVGRRSYQLFARTMLDLFWGPRLNRPGGAKYVDFRGRQHVDALGGKPFIALVTHTAGFEWTNLAAGIHGIGGLALAQAFKNPLLEQVFADLRTCTGRKVITQQMSMLKMLRRVMKGHPVGFLIDLSLPPAQATTIIETFGLKMCATYLHALLYQRTGASLLPLTSEARPDGSYIIEFHAPLEISRDASIREITQTVWNYFEARIRANPETWLWVYKHWRYRPRNAARKYPSYSNEHSDFEKLLRSEQIE